MCTLEWIQSDLHLLPCCLRMSANEEVITVNVMTLGLRQMTREELKVCHSSVHHVVKSEGRGFVCCRGDDRGGVVSWAGGRGLIFFKAESETWSIAAKQPK